MSIRGAEGENPLGYSEAYKKSKWGAVLDAFDGALAKETSDITGFRDGFKNWVSWMKEEGFRMTDEEIKENAFEQVDGITEEIYQRTITEFLANTLQRNDLGK